MNQSVRTPPILYFRGSPIGLDALVAVPHERFLAPPEFLFDNLDLGAGPVMHASDAAPGATRLRMTVARNTSPGIYKGSAKVGNEKYNVEVQIEPYVHLSVSPRQMIIEAYAGQRLTEQLIFANTGNVTCDIGKTHAFGLYDVFGAERSIGAAFREPTSADQSRLDRLVDELAQGHAGMIRLQFESGAGTIAPSEVRTARVDMHMPSGLKAGHTYTGTLPLHNLRYYVKVRATETSGK